MIKYSKIVFCTCILLFCYPFSLAVDFGRIKTDEIAYYIQDLKTGEILAEHQSDIPMSPASTMKLVTAFVAFKTLGKNYQWVTSWSTDSPIENNSLLGNLYWKGTNDPVFDQKDLSNMQIQLTQKGIHHINGNLVLDKSLQREVNTSYGFDKDKDKSFTTPPDTHNLANKLVQLYYYLDQQHQFSIGINPPLPTHFINIQTTPNPHIKTCTNLESYLQAQWDGNVLNIKGDIPNSCVGETMFLNIFGINEFIKYSFISYWQQLGNSGPKNVVIGHEPAVTKILAINYSPKLSDIIKKMNKYSNNLIARNIFLEIGKRNYRPAMKVITNTLKKANINTKYFFSENGSGLSRVSQVTAKMLGQVLYTSYYSSFKTEMIDSLPAAGIGGTLKKRLNNIPNLYLKTGTLDGVHALAGYKLASSPQENPIVIVVLLNQKHETKLMNNDLDQFLVSLLEDISKQQTRELSNH